MNSIAEKLQKIRDFINIQRNINNNSVEIIAVTKNFNKDSVAEALESGISSFGENRVQEAIHKYSKLKTQHQNISLHMIGPLQTNKVKLALSIFDVIQTLDREKLVKEVRKKIDIVGNINDADYLTNNFKVIFKAKMPFRKTFEYIFINQGFLK